MSALVNYPTDEMVAAAWIATIPGFTPAMAGTQLPPDADKAGQPTPWVETGFVTVAVVGGSPSADLPMGEPVIQCDCYATVPGSNFPPWNFAARLATSIVTATRSRTTIPRPLTITEGPVSYGVAVVKDASVTTSPRRLYDDVGDYARVQMDLSLAWIVVGEQLT
jgi:hypothetical protein